MALPPADYFALLGLSVRSLSSSCALASFSSKIFITHNSLKEQRGILDTLLATAHSSLGP